MNLHNIIHSDFPFNHWQFSNCLDENALNEISYSKIPHGERAYDGTRAADHTGKGIDGKLRLFINKDRHFFVEGEQQLGFLFNDFVNQKINKEYMDNIVNSVMDYSLNFDLQTPNFNDVKVISVHQILDINNNHKIKTSKRLGFQISDETNN